VKVRKLQTTHYNSYMSNDFKCKPVNTEMNHMKKKMRLFFIKFKSRMLLHKYSFIFP